MKRFRNSLILGTLILTASGFISRIIGFFNRIFISQAFGEEAMGIFQLTAPVMAFSFSLCCAGVQTAISKYTASQNGTHRTHDGWHILSIGCILSFSLSCVTSCVVYLFSDFIAARILLEPRSAPLLKVLAFSFPLSAIHCCINGYFYGTKNAKIPALLQICEQLVRVGSVYVLFYFFRSRGMYPGIILATVGIALGELCSFLFSMLFFFYRICGNGSNMHSSWRKKRIYSIPHAADQKRISGSHSLRLILAMAVPLSANRIIVNFLQSIEAIYIPEKLRQFGMTTKDALSMYGVLTGMALSLILFPSAITNSVAVLLLPVVSEAEAANQKKTIASAIKKSITYCSLLGIICTLFFSLFGDYLGLMLFDSRMAGSFIKGLSFICPFFYITTTLGSILHGLGKTFLTFCINVASLLIRILFIFFVIPKVGINGYLAGLITSQIFSACASIFSLRKYKLFLK